MFNGLAIPAPEEEKGWKNCKRLKFKHIWGDNQTKQGVWVEGQGSQIPNPTRF
jgi:hypothetical protein